MRPLHVATWEEVVQGQVTDVYFRRTVEVLRARGLNPVVRAEIIAKSLPQHWPWGILAGLEEAINLLKTLPVRVRAFPEGTVFRPWEPVLEIEGHYLDFAVYETALLGLLCQASGIATKAARCRKAAGDRQVVSFGARRMHPALTLMIERAAYIGGCDGTSVVLSGEFIGEGARGTVPHALILVFSWGIGSEEEATVEAMKAFDAVIAPEVPRVALIDTFNDEKFEAIKVAQALGPRLWGVRLDTPSSRRGNFRQILEEVRWELDLRGFHHVRLFVSGGIDEREILELRSLVDGFGVGTNLSNAPVVDFSLDIVEIEGRPVAKRGKHSGAKSVWRCPDCFQEVVVPRGTLAESCPCGGTRVEILVPFLENGQILQPLPTPKELRQRVLAQLPKVPLSGD